MSDRIHPSSVNDLRQLVRLHGAVAVEETLTEVIRQEVRPPSATERYAQRLAERGLKGDGTDVIKAKDARLGDIVRLSLRGEGTQPYSHCTVVKTNPEDTYNTVTLFRPYVHTSDFVTTAGIIPYVGFEQFTVHGTTELVLLRAGEEMR